MRAIIVARVAPTLSYCVVNTERPRGPARLPGRDRAHPPGRRRARDPRPRQRLRATARRTRCGRWGGDIRLIELERRAGKAANDSTLLREAKGRFCLLLNEDSELRPGAAAALLAALEDDPRGGRGGRAAARLRRARPSPAPGASPASAPPSPGPSSCTALLTVQSGGDGDPAGRLGPVERAAGAPRGGGARSATSTPTSSSTTTSATSASGSPRPAGTTLFVPAAEAVHHDQLSTDLAAGLPRIVEFHRNRDLYMRKHHSARGGPRGPRCSPPGPTRCAPLAATVIPGQPARIYWAHARQALFPSRGESIRDRRRRGRAVRAQSAVFVDRCDGLVGLGDLAVDRRPGARLAARSAPSSSARVAQAARASGAPRR